MPRGSRPSRLALYVHGPWPIEPREQRIGRSEYALLPEPLAAANAAMEGAALNGALAVPEFGPGFFQEGREIWASTGIALPGTHRRELSRHGQAGSSRGSNAGPQASSPHALGASLNIHISARLRYCLISGAALNEVRPSSGPPESSA